MRALERRSRIAMQEAVPMKPLVSVVVPMFNARTTVARALESLQRQTLAQWGAIVVDDGSTDGSADVVRGMAQEDARITLLHQPNRGPGAARNAGIERADGWFLHFLDADDWLEPAGLRTLVDRASEGATGEGRGGGPGGGMGGAAFGRVRLVGPEGQVIGANTGRLSALPPGSAAGRIGLNDLLEDNPISLSAAIVRRDLLGDVRFNEHQRFALDYDLWLRLALRGVTFRAAPDVVGVYRLRPGGQSRNVVEQLRSIDTFLADAYAAARETPLARRGSPLDASDTRRTLVMASFALRRATALALDPATHHHPQPHGDTRERVASAVDLFAPYADHARRLGWTVGSADAGRAAFESILHTSCASPSLTGAWTGALAAFWNACVERGWTDHAMIEGARRELALQLVEPDHIAATLLDRASAQGRTVTIVGLGNNGRTLAAAAIARGMKVLGRDDALPPGDPSAPKGVTIEPAHAPLARDGAVILSPLLDDVLVARLEPAAPGRVLRWSAVRASLASDILRELDLAFGAQPARLVA